ncbi:MAG: diadenylate cyclase CdaA [Clostridia bacterium]|nr:diadenylate cyclase CdaA [Clostridia bacterium]MBQ4638239.1 diadenylate cyclase CdaA [Clostridia bacterium]
MESLWMEITNFFTNTLTDIYLRDIFDIAIVAIVIYQVLKLTKKTRANQLLKGLLLVFVFWSVAKVLQLQTFDWLLSYVINAGAVAIVILFQPELRNALEQVGRGATIDAIAQGVESDSEAARVVNELVQASMNLSRRKVGMLIVIEQKVGLDDVIATGTMINALAGSALIENIFEPNTPLHDGAVVMRGDRLIAAGCFLHLTEDSELSRELGTRHRAAIGVTEVSDCVSLIVSEETGVISAAQNGRIIRYIDEENLRALLMPLFQKAQPATGKLKNRLSITAKRGERK